MARRRLTFKQKKFIKEYIKNNGNGTRAALEAYNVNNPKTAQSVATENLSKPVVQEGIKAAMQKLGLDDDTIINELWSNITAGTAVKATASDSIRGLELLTKLSGLQSKNPSTNSLTIHYHNLSKAELLEERKKLRSLTDKIVT